MAYKYIIEEELFDADVFLHVLDVSLHENDPHLRFFVSKVNKKTKKQKKNKKQKNKKTKKQKNKKTKKQKNKKR